MTGAKAQLEAQLGLCTYRELQQRAKEAGVKSNGWAQASAPFIYRPATTAHARPHPLLLLLQKSIRHCGPYYRSGVRPGQPADRWCGQRGAEGSGRHAIATRCKRIRRGRPAITAQLPPAFASTGDCYQAASEWVHREATHMAAAAGNSIGCLRAGGATMPAARLCRAGTQLA